MKDTIMANAEQALSRTFDLIVYGASGFTGRLVAMPGRGWELLP
jgi:hypothetical protein